MKRILTVTIVPVLAVCVVMTIGWHEKEHTRATQLAARLLPSDMPAFFVAGVPDHAAHVCLDTDIFKSRSLPELYAAEHPEHYIDLEMLRGQKLPGDRYAFIALCHRMGWEPQKVGTLPYAICEWTQRLQMAFAEHRRWPNDPVIQAKCLTYAGLLAHYAQDLCMPLHTSIHFDGRVAEPGDRTPRTGIHEKVDGLLRKLDATGAAIVADLEAGVFDDLRAGVVAELMRSHALVGRVYALEGVVPDQDAKSIDDAELEAFALERLRASVRFTASLYRTAWVKSADINVPGWIDRAPKSHVN